MARILIVDDEPAIRMTVAQALQRNDHDIEEAGNGDEALLKFSQCDPGVVVIDILMPDKEGIETIIELRKLDKTVKIIAMSGGGRVRNLSFLDIAKNFGCDATIKKPFSVTEIQDLVSSVLGHES